MNRDSTLQTLDRGLSVLEMLAESLRPLTLADISARLDVHRSIAYRLLRTLEDHRLVARAPGGYVLGTGTTSLGRAALPVVQQIAKGEVCRLAQRAGLTAFLVVRDGYEAVTLVSVEIASARLNVVYNPGTRHSLTRGSPGLAILAGSEPQADERPEVARGRVKGYVSTFGEVIPNQGSIAAPIQSEPGRAIGSIAITFGRERPEQRHVEALLDSARILSGRLARAMMHGAIVPDLSTTRDDACGSPAKVATGPQGEDGTEPLVADGRRQRGLGEASSQSRRPRVRKTDHG